jgi:hypothetical protein
MNMNLDLFPTTECDHLPVDQREFIDGDLVCSRCGKILRPRGDHA